MRVFRLLLWLPLLLMGTLLTTEVQAAKGKGYLGLLGGVALPGFSSSAFTFGTSVIYRPKQKWGVGLFLLNYGVSAQVNQDSSSSEVSVSTLLWGAEGLFFFGGNGEGLHAGMRMGLSSNSSTGTATDGTSTITVTNDDTGFFFAPKLAYDHEIGGKFTAGLDAVYFIQLSGDLPNIMDILVSFKYWF